MQNKEFFNTEEKLVKVNGELLDEIYHQEITLLKLEKKLNLKFKKHISNGFDTYLEDKEFGVETLYEVLTNHEDIQASEEKEEIDGFVKGKLVFSYIIISDDIIKITGFDVI